MSKNAVATSYVRGFCWIALLLAIIAGVSNIVELLIVDFIHGNPHRSQENAIFMMWFFTPIFGVVAMIGSLLVFGPSQAVQAFLASALEQTAGSRARFAPLLALPFTSVLTWYCYDYLTPSNPVVSGPEWMPFQHGISLARYLAALAAQTPITLFNFLYFEAHTNDRLRARVVTSTLILAVVVGGIWGYILARGQFRFT